MVFIARGIISKSEYGQSRSDRNKLGTASPFRSAGFRDRGAIPATNRRNGEIDPVAFADGNGRRLLRKSGKTENSDCKSQDTR